MLTAYFDEAYGKGFNVVCGWIASVEEWNNFEVDWKLFLISYRIPYFHMKEFAQSTGPFAKWKNTKYFRARFLHDAWEIIKSRVRRGFVCGIQDALFDRMNRFYYLQEAFPSCYALAGREAIDWAGRVANAMREDVKCIFDDGGPDKGGLIQAADVVPISTHPIFKPSRDIQDRKMGTRKGIVQIQAADFLAYELRKFMVDYALIRSGQRNARVSMQKFGQKKPDLKLMSEQRIIATCERYGVKRRS
jgi:hypothetical protein